MAIIIPKKMTQYTISRPKFSSVFTLTLKLFSLEMHRKKYTEAVPGDNVGMTIKGLDKMNMPKSGDLIFRPSEGMVTPTKSFVAQVVVQEHPGQLKVGFSPIIYCRTAKTACKMAKINWKMGKKTGGQKLENPPFLERGESAEVVFEPMKPFIVEAFDKVRYGAHCCNGLECFGYAWKGTFG